MEHYHILNCKWVGATDKLPARIKITSDRFNKSIYISTTDTPHTEAYKIAQEYLQARGWNCLGYGAAKSGYHLVTTNFQNLPKL